MTAAVAPYAAQSAELLADEGFTQIARNGFGDPANSYAFSMAWFEGALYVGTVRNMLALVGAAPPALPTRLNPWPVEVPADLYRDADQRGQIWRYTPARGEWDLVYASPVVAGVEGQPVPRDLGYRGMEVFAPRGSRPALYVAGSSSDSRGLGAHLLRLGSGGVLEAVSDPVLGDRQVSTIRSMVAFDGALYMCPTGHGRAWNAAESPRVFRSTDPIARWEPVSEAHFGDVANQAIYTLAVFRGRLYAGTLNPARGFEVWRGDPAGDGPLRWRKVVDAGAGRGPLNEGVVAMCVFKDALYVGSGISNGGYDRTHGIGPAPGEIIRIYPDDSWDLAVGTPRATGAAAMEPRSGLRAGFTNPFAGYIWSMAAHEDRLYVGTFDSMVFALWRDPRWFGSEDELARAREAARVLGGGELWRTRDGLNWDPVTCNGFGNAFNYGIRTLTSTPVGLFAGTANPFGPNVAVETQDGWRYAANPRGGAEVWLGDGRA